MKVAWMAVVRAASMEQEKADRWAVELDYVTVAMRAAERVDEKVDKLDSVKAEQWVGKLDSAMVATLE